MCLCVCVSVCLCVFMYRMCEKWLFMGKKVLHWEGNAETLCLSLHVFCTIVLYSMILGSGSENSEKQNYF